MHLHQASNQRETDAQASLCTIERSVHLSEHVEYTSKKFWWNPGAIVLDSDHSVGCLHRQAYADASAIGRVLAQTLFGGTR